ncbi:MAG: hypothetical protein ABIK68_12100 [bacterium]
MSERFYPAARVLTTACGIGSSRRKPVSGIPERQQHRSLPCCFSGVVG